MRNDNNEQPIKRFSQLDGPPMTSKEFRELGIALLGLEKIEEIERKNGQRIDAKEFSWIKKDK